MQLVQDDVDENDPVQENRCWKSPVRMEESSCLEENRTHQEEKRTHQEEDRTHQEKSSCLEQDRIHQEESSCLEEKRIHQLLVQTRLRLEWNAGMKLCHRKRKNFFPARSLGREVETPATEE